MKFSKSVWIFLAIGTFLLAAVFLVWTYREQADQQQQMALSFSQAQKTLAGIKTDDLIAKKTSLTQQIAMFSSQIDDTKIKLSFSKDSLDVTDSILSDAKNYFIDITDIGSSGKSTDNLFGIKCETLSFSIKMNGNLHYLSQFASSLSQVFPTSEIKSININGKEGSGDNYSASINLVIYNYKAN